MDKGQIITLIRLLSALESWSFSVGKPLPDYLSEMQDRVMAELIDEVLKDD